MGHAAGVAIHGIVSTIQASCATRKARRKENAFKTTGGLDGYSRTKANKEVAKSWTGAATGAGGSIIAGGAGAVVGQVSSL